MSQTSSRTGTTTHLARPIWMRWLVFWHSLAYAASTGTIIVAWLDVRAQSWQEHVGIGLLSLLWLGWYSICVRVNPLGWGKHPMLAGIYLLIGWSLWIVLLWTDAAFSMLQAVLFCQIFLFIPLPWKAVLALALTGLYLWQAMLLNGSWSTVLWFVLGICLMCIAIALFVSSIIKQSYAQRKLIRELEETRQELMRAERQAGIVEERQRLACEIHDTLAQGFTSIVMHLEAADAVLPGNIAGAQQHISQARHTARENLAEARRLMWALQPEVLDRASLSEVLCTVTEQWARESDLTAVATTTGEPRTLPPEYEHTLLRTTQEALTNVRKHAHASHVTLTLSYMEDMVTLDVQDDGVGMPQEWLASAPAGTPSMYSLGLKGLRTRIERLGGTLIIESTAGEGTTLVVALPICQVRSEEEQ